MRSHEKRGHTSASNVVPPDAYFYAPSHESFVTEQEFAPHRLHAIQKISRRTQNTNKWEGFSVLRFFSPSGQHVRWELSRGVAWSVELHALMTSFK